MQNETRSYVKYEYAPGLTDAQKRQQRRQARKQAQAATPAPTTGDPTAFRVRAPQPLQPA